MGTLLDEHHPPGYRVRSDLALHDRRRDHRRAHLGGGEAQSAHRDDEGKQHAADPRAQGKADGDGECDPGRTQPRGRLEPQREVDDDAEAEGDR